MPPKQALFSFFNSEEYLGHRKQLEPLNIFPHPQYGRLLPFVGTDDDLGAMILFEIRMCPRISRSQLYMLYKSRKVDPNRLTIIFDRIIESGFVKAEYPEYMHEGVQCPDNLRGDQFFTYIGDQNVLTEANAVQDDDRGIDKGQEPPRDTDVVLA